MTANQAFFDAQLRHATGLARYSAGEAKSVIALLDQANAELTKLIQSTSLAGLTTTSRRYQALLKDINTLRGELWTKVYGGQQEEMLQLAGNEVNWAQTALSQSVPVELSYATVDADTLRKIVTETPFAAGANSAKTMQQWWAGLAAADADRITGALQMGMSLGESTEEMVRRVMGTYDLTRANAAAVVRTAVNHVSEASRDVFWQNNADILQCLRWTSTLDGRTTPVCRARDGKFAPVTPDGEAPPPRLVPPTARPPAHASCRSLMVGILDADNIADQMPERPFVRDKRTGRKREMDMRAEAKAQAGSKWNSMSDVERNEAIRAYKKAWAKENIGQVPGSTTYDEWLRTQPKAFQDDVLGPARADMFRSGVKLDSFVAVDGRELTLKQLAAQVESGVPTWSTVVQQEWEAGLSAVEQQAIEGWTYRWDRDMRAVQRGQAPAKHSLDSVQQRISTMNQALDRAPVFSGEVSRGFALAPDQMAELLKSGGFSNRTFISGTRLYDEAKGFAFSQVVKRGGNLEVAIARITNNRSGVLIEGQSHFTHEAEVVLRPGARYRIVDRVRRTEIDPLFGNERAWWELIVEEVP